jgi:hypothetical protein
LVEKEEERKKKSWHVARKLNVHILGSLYNDFSFGFQIASRPGSPELLQQLIEIVRSINAPSKDEKARQSRDKKVYLI